MLGTCLFELAYASLDIFVEPSVRTFQSSCYLVQDLNKSRFGHDITLVLLTVYSSCYGSSMSVFACHFIYRYGAVNINFMQKYISGVKQGFLYLAPILTGLIWGSMCWFTLGESSPKVYFQEVFNLKIEECAYLAFHFWPVNSDGETRPDLMSFSCAGVMFLILGSSFASVIYFAIRCYQYISNQLGTLPTQSQALKSLQVQLFYSLILQSAIPSFLMYLPATIVYIVPMLNFGYNVEFPLLSVTIAIYPAIDPLPTMFIITTYRRGLIDMLRCRKKNNIAASS
ncbi:Seven TM Receptor [Caenorhabditis elegans]|uniref:Seven TM Receptor n=1 Tax=Caenorhabditis elegans TaxID=6239 RepID=Q9U2N0_CAEEL|nr:Seven TM Receptor [Caenorhabditis elegans]CAB63348.2 Seven TM Receptor [Caenorhabditis elegans]|eukprot:NP_507575.2 Uncharacterized protein CELE_Y37H2C.4 [Caenorhabditis elegans]